MNKRKESYAWGVQNLHLIWHGDYADPEVSYRNHKANYYLVEDTMYERFKQDNQITGDEPEDEMTEKFHQYCQKHQKELKELVLSI